MGAMKEKIIDQMNEQKLVIEILDALEEAKVMIRSWHGKGVPEDVGKELWNIYENHAPEMKRLNEKIHKAKNYLTTYKIDFPTIVCLCGSTRFTKEFQEANLRETLAGNIVLSIGADTKSDDEHFGHLSEQEFNEVKNRLDELHKRKIDLADEVMILNKHRYIGESTLSEINYAMGQSKVIRYLEDPTHA